MLYNGLGLYNVIALIKVSIQKDDETSTIHSQRSWGCHGSCMLWVKELTVKLRFSWWIMWPLELWPMTSSWIGSDFWWRNIFSKIIFILESDCNALFIDNEREWEEEWRRLLCKLFFAKKKNCHRTFGQTV
jgi:hypothetical protein